MAKELFIVFVYDTEVFLREEEDPQRAIVFFHPSWVSANRRMALCGQLMGVAQFLVTDFSFPRLISLGNGKFTMRKIGRFILCVGTDRNIPDWILSKRCEILYHTLQFFHANLKSFDNPTVDEIGEKLSSVMEIYLPVLLYPGNIFGNSPTIRLPKSGSSIFLEAAQLLEGLQDNHGVYGGAIFYQNKVVMSQLSVDITKQISITDPYRIKIPAKWISSSLNIPAGVQLLTVYINDDELNELLLHKIPNGFDHNYSDSQRLTSADVATDETDNVPRQSLRGLALVEEESDIEPSPTKNGPNLAHMPDIIKDTVKPSADDEKKSQFSDIKVESFVVESRKNLRNWRCCSTDSLDLLSTSATRYHSFKPKEDENLPSSVEIRLAQRRRVRKFYNTITDPTNTWFRRNGLPASKSLREDHISLYCQDLNPDQEKLILTQVEFSKLPGRKRPTNIDLNLKDSSKATKRKSLDLSLPTANKVLTESVVSNEVPLTPLMSKLSLMQESNDEIKEALLTPATSLRCLNDESLLLKKKKSPQKSFKKSNFRNEPRQKMTNLHGCDKHLTKAILFVFGYQNLSTYLLLNVECEKDPDFIHRLWKSCIDGVKNLERHFQQCFEGIPQTQPLNVINDSYGYLHLHSTWDTLQHGGVWSPRQTDVVNTIRKHFTNDTSLTDVTVRFEDCVIYGSQTADNQTYYQQQVEYIAGLPTPSDPMGLISLKAKRRLERDYGMLIM